MIVAMIWEPLQTRYKLHEADIMTSSGMALSSPPDDTLLELTADVVSAYVSNNSVPVGDLSSLISDVHKQLTTLNSGSQPEPQIEAAKSAVNPKKSS